jgi:phosphotransferase system IIB component
LPATNGATDTPPVPVEAIKLVMPGNRADLPKPEGQRGAVQAEVNKESAAPVLPEKKDELPKPAILRELPPLSVAKPLEKPITTQSISPTNNKNQDLIMETKNKTAFDEIAQGVTRIIFGDENLTEMNVRLTRIALERYNVPQMQAFDEIAQGVARIIFGDENISAMNVRLTRIALERFNVSETQGRSADANGSLDGVSRLASVSL